MNRLLKLLLCLLTVLSLNLPGLGEVHAAGVEVTRAFATPVLPNLPAGSAVASGAGSPQRSGEAAPGDARPDSKAEVWVEPDGWMLNVDVKFHVNARLEDLLEQGVPLFFVTEVEVFKPRWYWKDELVMRASQSVRLTYQAITSQYRVSRGPLSLNFRSLGEALRSMGTIRSWRFVDGKTLALKTSYDINVRFRLDKSQLPKPFQITMLTDSDWIPVSEWKPFSFTPELTKIAP